jgi:F-type H+-transporting ATPase subunit b
VELITIMDIQPVLLAAAEVAQMTPEAEQSLLGTLGINWKLFLAQLFNFAIVLFVFWKWIVKPLGTTLTLRQEKIEQGLKNAEYTEAEKKNFEQWKLDEMKKVRNEADQILRTTTDTANKIKQDTLTEAQAQAAKVMEQAKITMESDKTQMMKEARAEISTLVVSASEKILRAKLDGKTDQELISSSIKDVK